MAPDQLPFGALQPPGVHVAAHNEVGDGRFLPGRVVLDGEAFVAGRQRDIAQHRQLRDSPFEGFQPNPAGAKQGQRLALVEDQIGRAAHHEAFGPKRLEGLDVVAERGLSLALFDQRDFRGPICLRLSHVR